MSKGRKTSGTRFNPKILNPEPRTLNPHIMEESSLVEYRRISVLAVVSCLLGVLSITTFSGPLLLALPVAGVGIGLLALAKIAAGEGRLAGRRLALAGIFLAVLFGVAATARPMVHRQLLHRQAEAFTRQWFQLIAEGEVEQAVDLVNPEVKSHWIPRNPDGKPLDPENIEGSILDHFRQDEVVVKLLELGPSATYQCKDYSAPLHKSNTRTAVYQTYLISSDNGKPGEGPLSVMIDLVKTHRPRAGQPAWSTGQWKLEAKAPDDKASR